MYSGLAQARPELSLKHVCRVNIWKHQLVGWSNREARFARLPACNIIIIAQYNACTWMLEIVHGGQMSPVPPSGRVIVLFTESGAYMSFSMWAPGQNERHCINAII